MTFSSLTFTTLFFPAVLILYFICTDLRWRNGVLLVASLIFYSWGEPIWVLAMIGSTAINYVAAMLIGRASSPGLRKTALVVGAAASLAVLFYFKYAAFLVNSVTSLFGVSFSIPVLELPIGISFYTFQVLTYTVDVYRDKSPVQRDPFKLMLYVSCFPQLIAGPIVQYSDVAVMLDERESTPDGFTEGMKRFAVGLSKKVLLANVCGLIIEELPSAAGASGMSVLGAWYISVLYSLQLYFDFSGYSDMAIGMGRIFGFTYKENFNYPYISKSASEFWHRWHISLGSFFRDYVYIPLGGNRKGRGRQILNLLVVWALTGLWHGASWNFVLWGLYFFVLLAIEKQIMPKLERLPFVVRNLMTMFFVLIGWVLFSHTNMAEIGKNFAAMFCGAPFTNRNTTTRLLNSLPLLIVCGIGASVLPRWFGFIFSGALGMGRGNRKMQRSVTPGKVVYVLSTFAFVLLLLWLCTVSLLGTTSSPSIYANF